MRAFIFVTLVVGCQSTGGTNRKIVSIDDQKCNSTGCLGNPNYQPNPGSYPNYSGNGYQNQPAQSYPYNNGQTVVGKGGTVGNGTNPGYIPYYGSNQIVGNFWIPGYGFPGPDAQNSYPSQSNVPVYSKQAPPPASSTYVPPSKGTPPVSNPPSTPVPEPQPLPPTYAACAPEVMARNQTVSVGGSQFSQTATANFMTGATTVVSKFTSMYVVLSNGKGYSVNSITSPVFRNGVRTSNVTPVHYDSNNVAYMTVDGMNIPWGVVNQTSDGKARMDLINGTCVVQYGAFNGGIPVLVVP
ncbi:MAG: hypothetical protein WCI18_02300 [Pseudomonadota bacterium]